MKLTRIGVDIAKRVFQLHGADRWSGLYGVAGCHEIAGCRHFVTWPS